VLAAGDVTGDVRSAAAADIDVVVVVAVVSS